MPTNPLKKLIGEDRIDSVMELLSEREEEFNEKKQLENHFQIIKANYSNIKKKKRLGLEVRKEEMNELRYRLLEFIDIMDGEISFSDIDIQSKIPRYPNDMGPQRTKPVNITLSLLGISIIGLSIAGISGASIGGLIVGIALTIVVIAAVWIYTEVLS
ncbi:MAG: hypothetical protein AAFY76_15885 [Cyanobacteria bacterium J06649_11]